MRLCVRRAGAGGADRARVTVAAPTGTSTSAPDPVGLRRVLVTLCTTQVTSWGILYYAFPVLAGTISRDTGWTTPALTAAFSAGLVVSR